MLPGVTDAKGTVGLRVEAQLSAGQGRDQDHAVALVQGVIEVGVAAVEHDDAGHLLGHVELADERLYRGAVRERALEHGLAVGGVLLKVSLKLNSYLHRDPTTLCAFIGEHPIVYTLDQDIGQTRANLGADAFDSLLARGAAMALGEAATYATG